MKKVILALMLLLGWNARANAVAQVPVGDLRVAVAVPFLVVKGFIICGRDCDKERVAKRDGNYGFFAREGMAFSRVLTSPLNVVLPYFGVCNAYKDEESTFEYFTAMPGMLVVYAFYGAASTVDEVCVGTFEILTSMQVNQVYYPWESYRVSYDRIQKAISDGRKTKADEALRIKNREEEIERKKQETEQKCKNLEKRRESSKKRPAGQGNDMDDLLQELKEMN